MNTDFAKIVMNPVRQRIAQYLIINKSGTVNQISKSLSDIPKPSIYRHMKVLLDANCIKIIDENAIRGAVEKTYALVENPLGTEPNMKDIELVIQSSLMNIMASFTKYFSSENPEPQKDLLSLSSSTIMLSDKEFTDFFGRIGQIYNDYIYNEPTPERKPRCISIISAPPIEGE